MHKTTLQTKIKPFIFHVAIPIFLGFAYYYLFCPDVIIIKKIDCMLKFGFHIEIKNDNLIFNIIRCYLLDALWSYSLTHCLFIIIGNTSNAIKKSIVISVLMSVTLELLQLTHIIDGTFDIFDIFVEITAISIASITIIILIKGETQNEKEIA